MNFGMSTPNKPINQDGEKHRSSLALFFAACYG